MCFQSVTKLLSRIVAPDQILDDENYVVKTNAMEELDDNQIASTLHDHTFGITSDPLTQFACVFSSLIHDVDHPGVTNSQLALEDKVLADVYKGKSIAEQNSIDLAWDLFMSRDFTDLRLAICGTEPEMRHFRQLVINSVLATDIMDPELKKLRNNRWDVAFQHGNSNDTPRDKINRKATIVIEHIIQASDVAHTMQHWHIYRKWNERLFEEMYLAYHEKRAEKDPSEFWYKGEIGFFDFYIIPLAKKLSECGVFGISSDEYLNYALRNRYDLYICHLVLSSRLLKILYCSFVSCFNIASDNVERNGSVVVKK
jgi:3'5'-cyclic nucleotide phosphodiesterase